MRGYLLLLCGSLYAGATQAQTEQQAIQQWQSTHPTTQFVSADRYASLSKEQRELLGNDVIVYEGKITMALIEARYPAVKSESETQEATLRSEDASIIKNWRAENPDVKILPRSYYDSLDETKQGVYLNNANCLILEGEHLTVKDIRRFEQ